MAEEDPFVSMMELCEPTASQEARFPRRPVTLDTWGDSSYDEISSPAAIAIEVYSVPGTPRSDHHLSPSRVRASEDEPVEKRVRVEEPPPEREIEAIEIEDCDSDEGVEIVGEEKRSVAKKDGKEAVPENRGLLDMLDDIAAVIREGERDEGGEVDMLKTAVKKGMLLPQVRWWPPEGF